MTRASAGQKKLLGLGRYRFQERLSTCFFGPRYRITLDGEHERSSQAPAPLHSVMPGHSLAPGARRSMAPANSVYPASIRPSADAPLALRLVCADTQVEIERMARAVQSVRDLDHRAVLRPLQMVRSSTRLGVITEHIDGLTLAQLLANVNSAGAAVPPALTLRIIADVIEGLEALRAHATATRRQDWLFGGLTPDNILVGSDGQSRLLDPGLTGAAARQPAFAHEPSALAYTAPELTAPDAQYSAACDVFSIGVMLWELLTGQPLFAAATAAQTLENLHRAPIERVQRHQFVRGEPIPFALAHAVANALKRSPAQRTPDYDSLMTALVQAGPIGRPESVAEIVQHSSRKESIAEIKERIARMKQESEGASSTSPRITMPVQKKFTVPGLGLPSTLAPPPAPDLVDADTAPGARSTLPAEADPLRASQPGSARSTARLRRFPHAQGSVQITRVSHAPAAPRLGVNLEDQVSAFPIGDLQRRSSMLRRTHSLRFRTRVVPLLAAAVVLLGFGSWSLGLFDRRGPSSPPSAASGRAPQPPVAAPVPPPTAAPPSNLPSTPAPAPGAASGAAPDTSAAPLAPVAPAPSEAPRSSPAQPVPESALAPKPAAPPQKLDPTAPDAAPPERRRGRQRSEARVRPGAEPKGVKAPAQRGANAPSPANPESEPPRKDGVIKITPAPESPAAIPDDI